MGTSGTDFLSLLVPCEYPTAFAAGDGVVGDTNDLANVRNAHCFQCFSLCITDQIVRSPLGNKEVLSSSFDISDATSIERLDLLATLIIDIVPVLCSLNMRNLLLLCLHGNSSPDQNK